MARKNVHSHKMLDAVTLAASRTSEPTSVINTDIANIYIEWSAGSTPVGTITLQARNSPTGSWYDIDFGDVISVSGNSGSHQLLLTEAPFQDIRLVYTRASGDATLSATIVIKQVGG